MQGFGIAGALLSGDGDLVVKRLVFTDEHAVELGHIDPNDLPEQ